MISPQLLICIGVDNSETIKIPKSGGADPDGKQNGDLYVTVKVCTPLSSFHFYKLLILIWICRHSINLCWMFLQVREDTIFRREKADIHVDVVLSISQVLHFKWWWCLKKWKWQSFWFLVHYWCFVRKRAVWLYETYIYKKLQLKIPLVLNIFNSSN